MPSQAEAASCAPEGPLLVRRIPAIPGLLSLSEVELVLRGAFRAPRGSESCLLHGIASGECARDNRRKRLGVRLPPSAFAIRPGGAPRGPPPPDAVQAPPLPNEEDLLLEPLVLWDGELPTGNTDLPDATTAIPTTLSGAARIATDAPHAFALRAALVVKDYRLARGLGGGCVVVEPFLCRSLPGFFILCFLFPSRISGSKTGRSVVLRREERGGGWGC
jgi:hypothetical protein